MQCMPLEAFGTTITKCIKKMNSKPCKFRNNYYTSTIQREEKQTYTLTRIHIKLTQINSILDSTPIPHVTYPTLSLNTILTCFLSRQGVFSMSPRLNVFSFLVALGAIRKKAFPDLKYITF